MLGHSRYNPDDHVSEQHLCDWLQHESHHTPPRYLRVYTTSIRHQRCHLAIAVMCVIRDPSFRRFCLEAIHFDRHCPRRSTTLYDLDCNRTIHILERTHFRFTRPSTYTHSNRTWSNMSTPVRKRPEALARNYRLFVVGDANELGVRCAALDTDPIEIRRDVGTRDGVVDFISP
jgi:hypothetical protein